MKSKRLQRLIGDMRRDDARASSLAVGALLVITIIYSTTML
jgi:hypothetical protein